MARVLLSKEFPQNVPKHNFQRANAVLKVVGIAEKVKPCGSKLLLLIPGSTGLFKNAQSSSEKGPSQDPSEHVPAAWPRTSPCFRG